MDEPFGAPRPGDAAQAATGLRLMAAGPATPGGLRKKPHQARSRARVEAITT
jgi:hypothetical protein